MKQIINQNDLSSNNIKEITVSLYSYLWQFLTLFPQHEKTVSPFNHISPVYGLQR